VSFEEPPAAAKAGGLARARSQNMKGILAHSKAKAGGGGATLKGKVRNAVIRTKLMQKPSKHLWRRARRFVHITSHGAIKSIRVLAQAALREEDRTKTQPATLAKEREEVAEVDVPTVGVLVDVRIMHRRRYCCAAVLPVDAAAWL
jgi:hypothetical protein